jgi:hypothetical protein
MAPGDAESSGLRVGTRDGVISSAVLASLVGTLSLDLFKRLG